LREKTKSFPTQKEKGLGKGRATGSSQVRKNVDGRKRSGTCGSPGRDWGGESRDEAWNGKGLVGFRKRGEMKSGGGKEEEKK